MKQKRRGSSMKWEAKQKESACGGNCAGAAAARGFWLKWRWRTLVKLTTTSTIQTTAWRRRRRLTITPSFQRCISGMNRMIHVILLKNTRKRTHIKYDLQKSRSDWTRSTPDWPSSPLAQTDHHSLRWKRGKGEICAQIGEHFRV